VFFQRYQALQLLISLTLLIVISPFFDDAQGTAQLVLHLLFSLQLVSVVYVAAGSGRQLFIGVLLAGAWLVLRWSSLFAQIETAELISDFALVCINVYAVGVSLKRIITAKEVALDVIFGSAAVYLLLAVTWAVVFGIIEQLAPGSFALKDSASGGRWIQFLYYSLVTQSTLGYGDVTPISPVAQIWSALEATLGVFYLGILVARLVSIYRS
jgi:hypothetical protein